MAPSPRKRATALNTTWQDADATSFDPASLPVSRRPRAWERKPQVILRDGKEKKVWRTYATRSSTSNIVANQEEEDSRVRAVKRQQRIRPADMENMAGTPRSKKRAFKATRYDRRKSVLPRKNVFTRNSTGNIIDDSITTDTLDVECENGSASESERLGQEEEKASEVLSAVAGGRRRSARLSGFTFAVEKTDIQTSHSEDMDNAPSHPDELSVASKRTTREEETTTVSAHSPSKATSPLKSDQLSLFEGYDDAHSDAESDIAQDPGSMVPDYDSSEQYDGPDECRDRDIRLDPLFCRDDFHPDNQTPEAEEGSVASSESPEEDFTEASLQLALLQEPAPLEEPQEAREVTPEDVMESIEAHIPAVEGDYEQNDHQDASQSSMDDAMEVFEESPTPIRQDAPELCADVANHSAESPTSATEDDLEKMDFHIDSDLPTSSTSRNPLDDIADGLTLAPSNSTPAGPTSRRLLSPPPPPVEPEMDEATTTVFLDDDTAILKDFLTRAAASKASKTATIARRSSLNHRRDSDAIRQALASPRKVLEDKDPNSPSKYDNDLTLDVTLDLSQTLTLSMDAELPGSPIPAQTNGGADDAPETEEQAEGGKVVTSSKSSRRSTRARNTRLPAPPLSLPQLKGPKNISVRPNGGERVVLKKTEAQELGLLTRNNTRKNKQGAVTVQLRLLRLTAAEITASGDSTTTNEPKPGTGKRNIRWDETLVYYQEDPRSIEDARAEAQSLATEDELSAGVSTLTPTTKKRGVAKEKEKKSEKSEKSEKSDTRVRKVRQPGATNGTPGKGLLTPASLLLDGAVPAAADSKKSEKSKPVPKTAAEEKKNETQRLPKPKATKLNKMLIAPGISPAAPASSSLASSKTPIPLPTPQAALVQPAKAIPNLAKERKSRLATPRKVKLPGLPVASSTSGSTALSDSKENRTLLGGTPKKKVLKMPEVVPVASSTTESGLPRRRMGRKVV